MGNRNVQPDQPIEPEIIEIVEEEFVDYDQGTVSEYDLVDEIVKENEIETEKNYINLNYYYNNEHDYNEYDNYDYHNHNNFDYHKYNYYDNYYNNDRGTNYYHYYYHNDDSICGQSRIEPSSHFFTWS